MFEQEKFWYKKFFYKEQRSLRVNKMRYSVKLEVQELLMAKKGLDFTFSIAYKLDKILKCKFIY